MKLGRGKGLCDSEVSVGIARRLGLCLLNASGKKKGLELDNISFRKFVLKKAHSKTKVLEMLSLFFFQALLFFCTLGLA